MVAAASHVEFGKDKLMDIADVYVHDAVLLHVVEDAESETLTMDTLLPAELDSDDLTPRQLVF